LENDGGVGGIPMNRHDVITRRKLSVIILILGCIAALVNGRGSYAGANAADKSLAHVPQKNWNSVGRLVYRNRLLRQLDHNDRYYRGVSVRDSHVNRARYGAHTVLHSYDVFTEIGNTKPDDVLQRDLVHYLDFAKVAEHLDDIITDLAKKGDEAYLVDHWKLYHGSHHFLAVFIMCLKHVVSGSLKDIDDVVKRALLEAAIEHDRRDTQPFWQKPTVQDTIAYRKKDRAQSASSAETREFDLLVDFFIYATDFPDRHAEVAEVEEDRIVSNLKQAWADIEKESVSYAEDLALAAGFLGLTDKLANYGLYKNSILQIFAYALEETISSDEDLVKTVTDIMTGSYGFLMATAPVQPFQEIVLYPSEAKAGLLGRALEELNYEHLLKDLPSGVELFSGFTQVNGSFPLANYGRLIGQVLALQCYRASDKELPGVTSAAIFEDLAQSGLWMRFADLKELLENLPNIGSGLHRAYELGEVIAQRVTNALNEPGSEQVCQHTLVWQAIFTAVDEDTGSNDGIDADALEEFLKPFGP